ncbi:hypothetical protein MASR1M90_08770 [Desulfovibrionales bacterium]
MNVHGAYESAGLSGMETWDTGSNTRSTTTAKKNDSGDTVSFSREARELLREKLGRYSAALGASGVNIHAGQGAADESEKDQSSALVGEKSSGTQGVLGGSCGSSAVENIKKQIEALKSQLVSLASQENNSADSSVHSKIHALQTQIAALEAQLAEAEQAQSGLLY